MSPRTAVLVATAAVATILLSACGASMPTSGPVVDTAQVAPPATDEGFSIVPRPPQRGASAAEIVQGFLDAMQATPLSTTVARKYLASTLATSWNPQEETITYTDTLPPRGDRAVTVALQDAVHLDAEGRWLGALSAQQSRLTFHVVKEHGQWRIDRAPNALIVPTSWFQSRFDQMSLYFFDPTAHILVPEPVFVPNGSQLVTSLVHDLAAGPAPSLAKVERTFLPTGLDPGLSVPVDHGGTAQINLSGDAGTLDSNTLRMLTAQLAWTLSQDTAVKALHITVGGRQAQLQDGGATVALPTALSYDPTGSLADRRIFGIRKGVVVVRNGSSFVPVPGDLGATQRSLRSLGVDLTATEAAVVAGDGRSVLVEPLTRAARPSGVVVTGTDLLKPAWDADGDLWLVDRTRSGAAVEVRSPADLAHGGTHHVTVRVPGISGHRVRSFLVSRDGSRLIAVVQSSRTDTVMVSRIERNASGRVIGATPAVAISDAGEGAQRLQALAWRSPTSVVALQDYAAGALLHTLSVDGASDTINSATGALLVGDHVVTVVGTPVAGEPLYGTSGGALVDLTDETPLPSGGPVGAVTYVG